MIESLTLDQLRVLVTIEEVGSFSAAGRRLRRAQSAISHAIQGLEQSQGVSLFDRSSRIPELTQAGRALVAQAHHVLRQADVFERTAQAIAAGLEPELPIAFDSFVPTLPVIHCLAGLQAQYPDIAVTLFTEGIGAAERRVRDGSAIIGICALLPSMAQELQAIPLTKIHMIPVVAPSHALANETRTITRDILSEHVQLILTDPSQRQGPSFSVVSNKVWRFVDIARRLEFLLAGFGWCTMPVHLVKPYLNEGSLLKLDVNDPGVLPGSIGIHAIHERKQPLGVGARWLLSELQRTQWLTEN